MITLDDEAVYNLVYLLIIREAFWVSLFVVLSILIAYFSGAIILVYSAVGLYFIPLMEYALFKEYIAQRIKNILERGEDNGLP